MGNGSRWPALHATVREITLAESLPATRSPLGLELPDPFRRKCQCARFGSFHDRSGWTRSLDCGPEGRSGILCGNGGKFMNKNRHEVIAQLHEEAGDHEQKQKGRELVEAMF